MECLYSQDDRIRCFRWTREVSDCRRIFLRAARFGARRDSLASAWFVADETMDGADREVDRAASAHSVMMFTSYASLA
jgi:hypothetical protein